MRNAKRLSTPPLSACVCMQLFPLLPVRERERERERERDRVKEERCRIFLKGMTGALPPFSYLVFNNYFSKWNCTTKQFTAQIKYYGVVRQ